MASRPQRLGAEQVGGVLRELLVRVRPKPFRQRALGPRLAVLLDDAEAAVGGEPQDLRADVQVGEDALTSGTRWSYELLRARGNTIEGGTTEILKNIVAERVLGLPRLKATA